MLKSNILKYYVPILALAIFGGCSKKSPPLQGQREDIFISGVTGDMPALGGTVILDRAVSHTSWSQSWCNPQNKCGTVVFPKELKTLWQYKFYNLPINGNVMAAAPVASSEHIFMLDAGGIVHCLDKKTGKLVWHMSTTLAGERGQSGGAIVYSNGIVVVSSCFAECFGLDANTGDILWRVRLPSSCKGEGITIEDDVIYANCSSNTLQAMDLRTGKVKWMHKGIDSIIDYLGRASPVIYKDVVVTLYSSGEVICIQKHTGKELWRTVISKFLLTDVISTISHLRVSPVVDDGMLYVVFPNGSLEVFDVISGDKIWTQEIGSLTKAVVTPNSLFVVGNNSEIACLRKKDGKAVWTGRLPLIKDDNGAWRKFIPFVDKPGQIHSWYTQFITDAGLVSISQNCDVIFSDPQTGNTIKSISLNKRISVPPIIVDSIMYILSDDGYLTAYK